MTIDEAIKHAEEVVKEKLYEYQECIAVHDMENVMDCAKCGEEHRQLAEWLKDYKRLLEQEPVLDKIRAEIMQLDYDLEYIDFDYDDMAQTDEVHMIIREEVLHIINKYKVESEE